MKILAVIPARFASTRFPGKPLVMISNRPMIQWVYERAANSEVFDQVIVATDNVQIFDAVRSFAGNVEMTDSKHQTGTDRVAEVAKKNSEYDVVVNVQGDQPFVSINMFRELVSPYLRGEFPDMATLACPLNWTKGYNDPNTVKVICDQKSNALYFSRASIPYFRVENHLVPVYHHLGLYAFRKDFLEIYTKLVPTPLEVCEALEQLRALENGYKIAVTLTEKFIPEINTPEDLRFAESLLAKGEIF